MVDITPLLSLQARSRRNALKATRVLRRERQQAEEAQRAVTIAQASVLPDSIDLER